MSQPPKNHIGTTQAVGAGRIYTMVRYAAGLTLLGLHNEILELIMGCLIYLHASPRPLVRFLLSTKELCAMQNIHYEILSKPFILTYVDTLGRVTDGLLDLVDPSAPRPLMRWLMQDTRRVPCTPEKIYYRWVLAKSKQLQDHIYLVTPLISNDWLTSTNAGRK